LPTWGGSTAPRYEINNDGIDESGDRGSAVQSARLNKREARELVDLFFEELRAALAAGEQVKLSGFATSTCAARTSGRTQSQDRRGDPISARRVVTFRPGQKLKARVEAYAGTQQ